MKAIGIEIDKKRAICFALEKDAEGFIEYAIESGKYNYKTSMFKTTNSEEQDIAAAAYIGDKFPLAAIGIPTIL